MLGRPEGAPGVRVEEGATMGGMFESRPATWRGLRVLLVAVATAALALVALPTGASADPRVPPPACPPDFTLQGIERAPGGVIFTGQVVAVTAEVGRVVVDVERWYHRGVIPGLAAGTHPAQMDLALGPGLSATGRVDLADLPALGSRWIVAGTWPRPARGVEVRCGILADLATRAGAAWLERANERYAAFLPTTDSAPSIPLDAPWVVLAITALALYLAAAVFGTIAEARDPLPAA
jgi:hypothetical protein